MSIITEIDKLVEDYKNWLRQKTSVKEIDGSWVEITTPYLDRHNDALQIYAARSTEGYLLTDDSYTIRDLEASGCNLSTGKRNDLLRMTLNGFGVKLNKEALEIHATSETFPLRKHSLVQAMLAVNDLFYLAQPKVESLFLEDVTAWLDSADVRYTANAKFPGASGYDHLFEFVIPRSAREPERFVQAINRPSKETTAEFIFSWNDIRGVRSSEATAFAVLNDVSSSLSSSVTDAFRNYGINPIRWSERFGAEARLAA